MGPLIPLFLKLTSDGGEFVVQLTRKPVNLSFVVALSIPWAGKVVERM